MAGVIVFGALLLVAVYVSELAHRSILSTAVLFLGAGLIVGWAGIGAIKLDPEGTVVETITVATLFSVLFVDGMSVNQQRLRSGWRLPGRALLVGFPLTLVLTAVLAGTLTGVSWTEAFLVGAALAPTDPVFAAAIVGREEVPSRIRQTLNVESGLNDGLALPIVVVLADHLGGQGAGTAAALIEVAGGAALGVGIPLAAGLLLRVKYFSATRRYEVIAPVAVGLLVFSVAAVTGANQFVAAFLAGITLSTVAPSLEEAFGAFGEVVTELLKLAALLVLGLIIAPGVFTSIGVGGVAFVVLVLLAVRPLAMAVAMFRAGLSRREFLTVAWFGPKGFASVVYALLIVSIGVPHDNELTNLIAAAVVVSIVAHSSTDVLVSRLFESVDEDPAAASAPSEPMDDAA